MEGLTEAAQALCDGGLVLLPTDTVAGLAARPESVQALCRAKGRTAGAPFSWLFDSPLEILAWWEPTCFPPAGLDELWTLPVTLVLPGAPRSPWTSPPSSGPWGLGVRLGAPPWLARLALEAGTPYLLTSANVHGDPAPKSVEEASIRIKESVAFSMDGPPGSGTPSSVVAWTPEGPHVLRGSAPPALFS